MSIKHVLLVTNEPETVNSVTAAMKSNGELSPQDVCRDMADMASRLERRRSPAVLIDIDPDPRRMLGALEPLARKFSDTRFVVLGAAMHNDLLLGAMQAGARHFLLKQSIDSDLNRVLHQLCPDVALGVNGSAVTVLSAGGGCGATTVAVNLAAELQLRGGEEQKDPALVVDLDPYYGAVAAYLGVEADYGVLDLLNRSGTIDSALIQSASHSHSEALHTLVSASRERLGATGPIDPARLGQAIDACKAAYRWTVIDAPRVPMAAAAELAHRSVFTLLLMQLTVKDIRSARRMLAGLAEHGVPTQSVRVFATRYRKRRHLIDPVEGRTVLGLADDQPLGMLSNDYYTVAEAVNLGKPLAQVAPRSDIRRDLQKLAAVIHSALPAEINKAR